jgi:glycosyltransferase involved in cell wall biosynthesis
VPFLVQLFGPTPVTHTVQSKIKICILAPSLEWLGGQSRQASRLITGLRTESALSVDFIPHDPRLPKFFAGLQQIKYVKTAVTWLMYCLILFVRLPKYDVLHVFCASYYAYALSAVPAILLGKVYGKKVIVNYRSGEAEDHLQNWRWTALPTIRLADAVVVPSGYLVDVFRRFGIRARPIHNIVELDRFPYRERHPPRPVFLTTRLLEPLYNVGCVLRAFAMIQRRVPEASLTVGGDGWQRSELEDLAAELGLRNTTFIGRVSWEKMPELYDSADVYLTATNLDNMPSSVIESFASGLPVVTTDAGGLPYIVKNEETGIMVPCGDHEALAIGALRLLEEHGLAARLAYRARQECRKYSWETVRTEWMQLYRELASDAKSPEERFAPTNG